MINFSASEILGKLANAFPPETVSRGSDYYNEGRVKNLHVEKENATHSRREITISAEVSGEQRYKLNASLTVTATGLEVASRCSCPMSWGCKHVVAAIYAMLNSSLPQKSETSPAKSEITVPTPVPLPPKRPALTQEEIILDPAVEKWLDKLRKAAVARTITEVKIPAPAARMHFVLRLTQRKVRIEGALCNARYSMQPVHLWHYAENPQGVAIDDVWLIRKLISMQNGGYDVWLQGPESGVFLEALLATGNCHFGNAQTVIALSLGAERTGKPKWIYDKKGSQRPSFEIDPPAAVVLPLLPLYYVDETNGTCGRIRTSLPDSLAREWMEAPPLRPKQANAVAANIQGLQNLGIPAPVQIVVEKLGNITPIPHLHLFSFEATSYYRYSGDPTRINAARLEFAYNDIRFHYAEPKETHWIQIPEKLIRINRNLAFETKCADRLEQMGLEPLSFIFSQYNLGRPGERFTKDDFGCEDSQDWFEFQTGLGKLEKKGWKITIDPSFEFQLARADDWYLDATSEVAANDWFSVDLGVNVDGQKLNLLPILVELIRANPSGFKEKWLSRGTEFQAMPVPLPDGRSILFPVERLRSIIGVLGELLDGDALDAGGHLRVSKLRATELSAIDESQWRWLGSAELREFSNRLRNFEGIKSAEIPANFRAELRPYQREGLNWLQFLREYELGGVLADDMGLGKTIQTLAHLLIEKQSGRTTAPSLVIAPTSVLTNWRREAERFAPDLRVVLLHGPDRKEHYADARQADLVITSYALLPRDCDELLKFDFHYVILDEAQYIKNPKTTYAQTAGQLKARHRLCLTGTPMENHLGELWSIFTFLLPGLLGNERQFNSHFRKPIEKHQDAERRDILARRVKPFLLRRRKEDVLTELPPKTEIVHNIELEGGQRDLYESIRLAMHERVRQEIDKKGISRAHIIILDALLKLRQVCCDPRLVKLPSAKQVSESAKLDLLMDLLPEMIGEGRRILLFSQFTSMLALIEQRLKQKNIEYVLLTGSTSDRDTPVKRFQDGKVPLFLISLKAGGTGLNLTSADTVIHYDPWWNPAVENQATDRAHRIGQTKQVFVYKLITVGTVEEKIATLQIRKRELVEGLLSESGSKAGLKIELEDLESLFAPLK